MYVQTSKYLGQAGKWFTKTEYNCPEGLNEGEHPPFILLYFKNAYHPNLALRTA